MDGEEYGAFDWWLRTHLFYWAQGLLLLIAALLVLLTYYVGPHPNWSWVVAVALVACVWVSLSVTVVVWLRMIKMGILLESTLRERHRIPAWQGAKVVGWPGFSAFRILLGSMATLLLGYIGICVAYAIAYSSVCGVNSSGFPTALYFSVIASSTVGFGDVAPVGPGRLFAILQVISGLTYTIMGIGSMVMIFSRVVTGLAPGIGIEESDGNVVIPGVFIEQEGGNQDSDN